MGGVQKNGNHRRSHHPHEKLKCWLGRHSIDTTWQNRLVPGWQRSVTSVNLYAEYKLRAAGLEDEYGFKIGGRNISNLFLG